MEPVTLPLWAALLMAVLSAWAVSDRIVLPAIRGFVRRRAERVVEELNPRLQIEIQPFQRTRRSVLVDRLLFDPKVMEAVQAHAQAKGQPREEVEKLAARYAREIVPAFNAYFYFRLGYALARRLARLLYRVRLGFADDEALQAVPKNAAVVFVMNHRSNMDYILVGYLAAGRAALSYAVGEWARVWPLRAMVRSLGGYFVRRDSRDDLYRRVLERYVAMATAAGVPQALYPEGGLTRDGRLRTPKLGLLDYMLRSFDPYGERDLVFIPVGINYDRTLEDRTLLRDLEPGTPRRSAWAALATTARFGAKNLLLMARSRWHRFGYACVNFGPPLSMRRYLLERRLDLRSLPREERCARVAELGARLMEEVGAVIPVLPVSLVAAVFIREAGRPMALLGIKARVHALLGELEGRGARVYVPRKDRDYAVEVGLRMLVLRRLVLEEEGLYRAHPDEGPLLAYYANALAHFFSAGYTEPAAGSAASGD
ncbi:MAG: 1-acyl-sn-glycerol-3-phosphate acyltransferase [Acidobacteriota bacterium]